MRCARRMKRNRAGPNATAACKVAAQVQNQFVPVHRRVGIGARNGLRMEVEGARHEGAHECALVGQNVA